MARKKRNRATHAREISVLKITMDLVTKTVFRQLWKRLSAVFESRRREK